MDSGCHCCPERVLAPRFPCKCCCSHLRDIVWEIWVNCMKDQGQPQRLLVLKKQPVEVEGCQGRRGWGSRGKELGTGRSLRVNYFARIDNIRENLIRSGLCPVNLPTDMQEAGWGFGRWRGQWPWRLGRGGTGGSMCLHCHPKRARHCNSMGGKGVGTRVTLLGFSFPSPEFRRVSWLGWPSIFSSGPVQAHGDPRRLSELTVMSVACSARAGPKLVLSKLTCYSQGFG